MTTTDDAKPTPPPSSGPRAVALRLAAIAAVKKHLTGVDTATKAELLVYLDLGDRKGAVLPDGTSIGTVYVTVEGDPQVRITDSRKFLAWVKKNRPTAIIEAVRESDEKSILEEALTSGELPDGTEIGDGKASYVGVRQTEAQRQAVVDAWRSGALALPAITGEIEA